jgi:hypothetical protein
MKSFKQFLSESVNILVCATNSAGADVFASLDWEEVSR